MERGEFQLHLRHLESADSLRTFWTTFPILPSDLHLAKRLVSIAIDFGCTEIITDLLEQGFDPDEALSLAIKKQNHVVIESILASSRNEPARFQFKYSTDPLFAAVGTRDLTFLQQLERHGFSIDTQVAVTGRTISYDLLTYALMAGSQEIVIYLKAKGLKVDVCIHATENMLDKALRCANLELVDSLLSIGWKTASPSALSCTLDRAYAMGNQNWVNCLLKHRVDFFSPMIATAYLAAETRVKSGPDLVNSCQVRALLGKVDPTKSGFEIDDTQLILSWIRRCVTDHKICNMPGTVVPTLPSRVIDLCTSMPFLVETAGQTGCYATLSHCWKSSASVTLTTVNIANHKGGFDVREFSKTFQTAITIVRSIGIRYLWIDALCILQDSTQDWQIESERMAYIYQNALVNIALEEDFDIASTRDIRKLGAWPGMIKKKGHLDQRAWILQERLLAVRTVSLCGHGIFWDCAALSASEEFPRGFPMHLDRGFQLREDRIYREMVRTGTLMSANQDVRSKLSTSWRRIVEEYTRRRLTKESDKLTAIQGLANAMEQISGDKYLAGMWNKQLWADLLWRVDQYPLSPNVSRRTRHPRLLLGIPSWSWASVRDCVTYEWPNSSNHYGEAKAASIYSLAIGDQVSKSNCLAIHGRVKILGKDVIQRGLELCQDTRKLKLPSEDRFHWYPDSTDDIFSADKCVEIAQSTEWTWGLVLAPLSNAMTNEARYQRIGLILWPKSGFYKLPDADADTATVYVE